MTAWGDVGDENWVLIVPARGGQIQITVCEKAIIKHNFKLDSEHLPGIRDAFEVIADIFWRSGRRFGSRETSIMGW